MNEQHQLTHQGDHNVQASTDTCPHPAHRGSVTPALAADKPARAPKISKEQATAIALKARPGKVVDEELESESGGSGLRYSFDIKVNGVVYEVGVDADTGEVLENKIDDPKPD